MDLKVGIEQVKIRLLELWNYRIFKFAVIIHLSYFIISLILIGFKPIFKYFINQERYLLQTYPIYTIKPIIVLIRTSGSDIFLYALFSLYLIRF